ncbi:MAG: hypothetical protein ABI237_06540 [Ginsengibacter sp.]
MNLKKVLFGVIVCLQSFPLFAKDYEASYFGIKSDGKTLNIRTIQFAIDHINKKGGGRLVFTVGKYPAGSIFLKSNIVPHLEEGSVLLRSMNPFDYELKTFESSVVAYDQQNVTITGSGTIYGQGNLLVRNVIDAIEKGLIKDTCT